MADYKTMYYRLAGKVADVIDMLVEVQRENEEMAMDDDVIISLLDSDTSEQ